MDFDKIYNKTTESIKLKFLNAIIEHNSSLQKEFVHFTQQEEPNNASISSKSFLKQISETQEQYVENFESVDLMNPDWDNYNTPHSGYIEEWEQYQQASEQEFEQFFEYFKSEVIDLLIQQEIGGFIASLSGLYEACLNARIEDEVGSFEDVNEYLIEEHARIMSELIEKIEMSAISDQKVNSAIKLFFKYCDEEYPGNSSYPEYFEPLIMALADISDQPDEILSFIDASKVERVAVPQLILLLNKNAGNSTEWLQSAQQYYLGDDEVAKQLLDYYFENDKNTFVKTANELFSIDNRLWARFLSDKMDKQLNVELFKKVFFRLTIDEKQIEYYKKIKTLLSSEDFDLLINEINWDKAFTVRIYEEEKKFEEIKQVVKSSKDSWDYEELISPILNVYPEFCFSNIRSRAKNTLANNKGRSTYKRIASWLKLAKTITGYQDQVQELVLQLYKHKPNLPALKDEFRNAGLV